MLGRKKLPAEFLRDLEDGEQPIPSSSYDGLKLPQENSSRLKSYIGSASDSGSLSLFRRQKQYDELLDDADSHSTKGPINGLSEAALRSGGDASSSGGSQPHVSSSSAPDGLLSRLTLKGKTATMMPMSFSRVGGLSQGGEAGTTESMPRKPTVTPPPAKLGSFARKGSSSGKSGGVPPPVSKGPLSSTKASGSGGKAAATKRSRMLSTDANYDSTSFEALVDEDLDGEESPPEKGTIPMRSAGTSPFQYQETGSNALTPSRTPDHATPVAQSSPSLMSQAAKLAASLQGSGRALLTKRRSGESFMLIDDSALESSTQSESGEDAQKAACDGLPASLPARLPAAAGRQMRSGNASSPGSRQPLLEDSLAYPQSASASPSLSPGPSLDNRLPGGFHELAPPVQHFPSLAQYPPSLPAGASDSWAQNGYAGHARSASQRSLGAAAALDSVSSLSGQARGQPSAQPVQRVVSQAPCLGSTAQLPPARQVGRASSAGSGGSNSALDSVSSFRSSSKRSTLAFGEYRASDPGAAQEASQRMGVADPQRRHSEGLLRSHVGAEEAEEPAGESYNIFEPRADAEASMPSDGMVGSKSGSVLKSLAEVKSMKGREVLQALHRGAHLRKKWVNGTSCADAAQANKTLRLIHCRTEGDRVLLYYKPQGMKGLLDKEEVSATVQRVQVPDGTWKLGDCILVFTSRGTLALEALDTATHATWVFGLNAALSSCQARRKDVLLEAPVHTIPRNPMFVVAPGT